MNIIELMKKVQFDMNYTCEDGSQHTVHMFVTFKEDMAELSISVDKNRRRMWMVGVPYDQPNNEYYSHEDTFWWLRRYIQNNTLVEWYLENDGQYPDDEF